MNILMTCSTEMWGSSEESNFGEWILLTLVLFELQHLFPSRSIWVVFDCFQKNFIAQLQITSIKEDSSLSQKKFICVGYHVYRTIRCAWSLLQLRLYVFFLCCRVSYCNVSRILSYNLVETRIHIHPSCRYSIIQQKYY